jgi:threonyl-tRNA synthetase
MNLDTLRHSASHILAQAVKRLYKDVKLGIGPPIEDGFYYDFDLKEPIKEEDLPAIEEKMKEIVKEDFRFEREEMLKEDAIKLFEEMDEPYKIELIKDLGKDRVTIYRDGDFTDLCKGPNVSSTVKVKHFKILNTAGAYWRGNENNPQLTRIYGTAFESEKELESHLKNIEEAKKRDHRKGQSLGYFSMHNEVGPGLVIYHPKGAQIRSVIEDYLKKEHLKRGYKLVYGPHIMKSDIWQQSGHYDYYKENMYIFEAEEQEYAVKPMNCPAHILVYRSENRSYNDLPIKFFELGTVYRHEKSGVLHGLLRARGFTQDDAHIFCTQDQLLEQIIDIMNFVKSTMKDFGFTAYEFELSTRPEKYIGTEKDWDLAEDTLKKALEKSGEKFDINEGDGAFYGPKIDIKIKDALGRPWQCATIQCDFALPEKFDLKYTGSDGRRHRPVMLHRVIVGSLERFIAILLEHYDFALPVWLAPTQVKVLPITSRVQDYAEKIRKSLTPQIRVETDLSSETLNYKIRKAQKEKVPYMCIVGDKEKEADDVSVRTRDNKKIGPIDIKEFKDLVISNIDRRR